MSSVKTGELLDFQDYSPESDDRTARIDVESVHTNQYRNQAFSNPNYTYPTDTQPQTPVQDPEPTPSNHNFWTIEYYQKYFDVHTSEVVERIVSSVIPTKVSSNFFDERVVRKPDLYGPTWISITLIFTIAVSGNIANYLQSVNKAVHWRYDFHLVSYAATAITCYVWVVPMALWVAIKWTTPVVRDEEALQINPLAGSPSMMSLFCLYGYSLSIYVPVAVLWTIQVGWLQWLLVLMAALVSGAVLIYWLLGELKKSKYCVVLVGSILACHFLLATGFMLYFFHVPSLPRVSAATVAAVTTAKP